MYLQFVFKPMHHTTFLQTAIFMLMGKNFVGSRTFYINFAGMELSKFKCLCAYIFYMWFFFSYSVSVIPLAVDKYGIS